MELRNLITFLKVVELQNFTRAAEQLNYSQSTVTIQMQQLEEELHVKLFERIGKHITVTEKGWEVFRYAQEIRKIMEEMSYTATKDTQITGKLRVGIIESLLFSVLSKLLLVFNQKYPSVEIIIKTDHVETLIEMMQHNEVDLIFIIDYPMYNREWLKPYQAEEKIAFFAPYGHFLTVKEEVSIDEVLKEPFLLTEKEISYRKELDTYIEKHAVDISIPLEIGSTKMIVDMMKNGCGISFLPAIAVMEPIKKKQIAKIPVVDWNVVMWKQLIYHKNKYVTPQMNAFIQLLIEQEKTGNRR